MKRLQKTRVHWLAPLCLVLAFQSTIQQQIAAIQQSEQHGAAAGLLANAGGQPPTGPMLSMGSESSSALESSAALAGDDLIAAESSPSSDSGSSAAAPESQKSFTSGQVLGRQQQEAASVAPVFSQQPPQQQQQPQMGPQQQMYGPAQQLVHQRIPNGPPKAFNSFMAAALAGNYGHAQQQIAAAAAAAAGLQRQHPLVAAPLHPQQSHQPPQMIPAQMQHHQHQHQHQQQHHQQLVAHPQPQHQHQSQPHQMQQQVLPPQLRGQSSLQQPLQEAPMAVQESSVRNNIVPAPQFQNIDSNTIDESIPSRDPSAIQMATASSASHAVIAPATGSELGGANAWPLQAPDIPKIVNLEVKCEKNLMKVSIEFDKVFNGVIFSKGHYNQGQCLHVAQNSGKHQAYFDISINSCGTQGNTQNGLYGMGGNTGSGTFFENTIVVQYDPNVQEVYDHARKLRCTWHDQYEKAVTFRPFPVDMLDIVRADFAGDNVGCWMQIQVGKGPWASEVAGIVKIGQTMTMVLAIKDEENKFDMLVRNCFAHDGKRGPIELVDKSGCITRPKLMSRFTKIKNFGSAATVLSYAHFQAFKFPDSMEVHFQCTIQICRHQCPEQCSSGSAPGALGAGSGAGGEAYSESTISGTFNIHGSQAAAAAASADSAVHLRKYGSASSASLSRERRDLSGHHNRWLASNNGSHHQMLMGQAAHRMGFNVKPMSQTVGLNRVIQVVSTGDLAFAIQQRQQEVNGTFGAPEDLADATASQLTSRQVDNFGQQICMSSYNFVLSLVVLALILLCSSLAAVGLYMRQRSLAKCSSSSSKLLIPSAASIQSSACASPVTPAAHTATMRPPQQHHNNVPRTNQQQLYTNHHHHHLNSQLMFEGPSH